MFELMTWGLGKVDPPPAGTWQRLAYPYPSGNTDMAIAVVGTDIYVFAGALGDGTNPNQLWKYDTLLDTWTQKRAASGGYGISCAAVGKKIYYFSGVVAGNYVRTVRVYDTETDLWSTQPTQFPSQYNKNSGMLTLGDRILIVGGKPLGSSTSLVMFYTPATDSYSYPASYPIGISENLVFTLDGNEVISVSGQSSAPTAAIYSYDVTANKWTPGDPATLPGGVGPVGGAVINGMAYVVSGSVAATMLGYDGDKNKWSKVVQQGSTLSNRIKAGVVAVGDSLYVLGGRNGSTYLAEFWKFTPV